VAEGADSPIAFVATTRYWYEVSGVRPVSLRLVLAVVPIASQFAPLSIECSTRYAVALLLAVHITVIWVEDSGVAETLVGVPGRPAGVVAVVVGEAGESPAAFVAKTR
jgi:hypothetical protein